MGIISLGAWATFGETLNEEEAAALMAAAYDSGINFFDNADVYGNGQAEQIMGCALRRLGWPRESYLVSSKVFWGAGLAAPTAKGLSRKHVFDACHAALKRLRVDYLDLYFCHRFDPETPLEETVRAMSDLVSQGKVLYWGTSEWSAQQILEARAIAQQQLLVGPITEQPKYNLLHRQRVELEYLRLLQLGMGMTI
jgi:aryl-alcohol dehydrogenase-like predicted oxidoreductase